MELTQTRLNAQLNEAELKAYKALASYKFIMFGYWAAMWVHLNKLNNIKNPNPFRNLVDMSKRIIREKGNG
jgi:hypothetical protein